ncbi:hypothetical protein D9758_002057 [Tetrapyrgos nigripes]|uniref:Transposase n=1 Tax=Tetrapyrgos nigripes TaxID=182062 RepID=A0A8H5LUL7_9AGAR|nr:hypothetical protein D9758_002057 [Tetrapyrgos nigripes]
MDASRMVCSEKLFSFVMPQTLSVDLHKRIVHWRINEQREVSEIAELAGCAERTVYSILKLYADMGTYQSKVTGVGRPRLFTMEDKAYTVSVFRQNPTLYLNKLQDRMWRDRELDVSIATISRTLREMAMSNKKVAYEALQRDERLQNIWIGENGGIPMEYIVCLDEAGIRGDDHHRLQGWESLGMACA